jgi:hypothetical protein
VVVREGIRVREISKEEGHLEQARMIRRYIAWRNRHADNQALRELVKRANVF